MAIRYNLYRHIYCFSWFEAFSVCIYTFSRLFASKISLESVEKNDDVKELVIA